MGSGASKKKSTRTTTTVITASLAFKRAGRRAKKKDENSTDEGLNQNETSSSQNNNHTPTTKDVVQNGLVPDGERSGDEPVASTVNAGGFNQPSQHDDRNEHAVAQKKDVDRTTGGVDRPSDQNDVAEPEHDAIIKIQSVFRGHQDRQLLRRESEMAIKIQRRFRRHLSMQSTTSSSAETDEAGKKKVDLEARKERREQRERAWLDDTPELLQREDYMQVGEQTMEEFNSFQDEITMLKWKSEQQIERIVYGDTHSPRKILLISSNIPKSKQLTEASLEEVITFNYDFAKETFESLIAFLRPNLDAYKLGCMARSICFVCQGAPGVMYLLKKRALTVPKLKKESEADQVRFWQSLGKYLSKIRSQESLIHVMGCNVMGNEKGQKLFDELQTIARPAILKIRSPLELSEEGNNMIATYFDVPKYKTWKMRRYSKTE